MVVSVFANESGNNLTPAARGQPTRVVVLHIRNGRDPHDEGGDPDSIAGVNAVQPVMTNK